MQEAIYRINIWIAQNDDNTLLDLSNLGLTELPPIPRNCKSLYCDDNKLTSLPDLPSCTELSCIRNKLTSLPDLPVCKTLWCYNNCLTHLPQLYKCELLSCNNNSLTFLPQLPKCRQIYCDHNSKYLYTTIDTTHFPPWYDFENRCMIRPPKRDINYNKHVRTIQRAYRKHLIRKYTPLLNIYLLKGPVSIVCAYIKN
jgi:hypothetical protein